MVRKKNAIYREVYRPGRVGNGPAEPLQFIYKDGFVFESEYFQSLCGWEIVDFRDSGQPRDSSRG